MYECVMAENIHESIYDLCESVYDNICYCECNYNRDHLLLVEDLINFIDDRINSSRTSTLSDAKRRYSLS